MCVCESVCVCVCVCESLGARTCICAYVYFAIVAPLSIEVYLGGFAKLQCIRKNHELTLKAPITTDVRSVA